MNKREIFEKLTLDEKLTILTAKKGTTNTVPIERVGLRGYNFQDGPYGIRLPEHDKRASCFPPACSVAAAWDEDLTERIGAALAEETAYFGYDLLFGPAVNIKRNPICGRNFEYFSEDPYLTGKLAAAYIRGLQGRGIAASIKHFAANNQEYERIFTSSEVDIRPLHEIYCRPFQIAIEESDPWTIMCAYNRLNGIYCSENLLLEKDILRDKWKYNGVIVSDYGAVHDRTRALKATLEWEMPYREWSADNLRDGLNNGEITMEDIDQAVMRLLDLFEKIEENADKRNTNFSFDDHHKLIKEAATESINLLKNEDNILPINGKKYKSVTFIGQFGIQPAIQGCSSATVTENPEYVEKPIDFIRKFAEEENIDIDYDRCFFVEMDNLFSASGVAVHGLYPYIKQAASTDLTVVFVGDHPKHCGGEGRDRQMMTLENGVEHVILQLAKVNPNLVVVVQAGQVLDMSRWIDKAKAVLFQWYAGDAAGSALAEALFGRINPCGKTPETFPLSFKDSHAYADYPGDGFAVAYREGVMVGYRYYEKYEKNVLFPFGFGLSYTTFEYSNLKLSASKIKESDTLTVTFDVKNTGDVEGKEVCQIYVEERASKVIRPVKELKAFKKVALKPGETKSVSVTLDKKAFEYFNIALNDWHVETNNFRIHVGASSADIRLTESVFVEGKRYFS